MKNTHVINKKSITIYTIVIMIFSMIVFEIAYCNTVWLKGIIENKDINYNFSLCRIIIYIVFIILYIIFRKKFIEEALKVSKNKYKRIFIYFVTILAFLCIGIAVVLSMYNSYFIRAVSVGLITAFLGTLFVIYV